MPSKKTKSDAAVEKLRLAILSGEIAPGEWLRQDDIAERFNVSPTPVREAFRRLEADGLLERIPHQGVKVIAYTPNIAREYFDLRLLLEPYAIGLAAKRMSAEDLETLLSLVMAAESHLRKGDTVKVTEMNWKFHEVLVRMCGSRLVQDVLNQIRRSFQLDTLLMLPDRAGDSVAEHRIIYEALARNDVRAATREMKKHTEHARDAMLARLPMLNKRKP